MTKEQIIAYALALAKNSKNWSAELKKKLIDFDKLEINKLIDERLNDLSSTKPNDFYSKEFLEGQTQALEEVKQILGKL